MISIKTAAAASVAALMMVGSASAVTLPEPTVHFDTLTSSFNGPGAYTENGFDFDPTSFQSGNCSDYPDPSDPCIKEVQQTGVVTTMTRNGGGTFTLTGFYFDLQGRGSELRLVTDKTAAPLVFAVDALAPSGTQLYDNYQYLPPLTGSVYNGAIGNNDSYFVMFDLPEFNDVSFVTWSTYQAQNLRIDDILVAPVPLPAAGWLLLAGAGGVAAMTRRKKM
ncbi:VPLPA-CTERM sorting domain-containing protein [Rhodovulum marinum]|uniref:Putative secreted protein n=1 Tax=Rhodovulum marinum TaxID=320662 RepID=A0A4R2Q368_9RHOB|nr:VPLPA-CTERM sorting domain-containing protein [Rhodovulum marinum]TCP42138.1 putative secreted protein [Rhodovulum marinum]